MDGHHGYGGYGERDDAQRNFWIALAVGAVAGALLVGYQQRQSHHRRLEHRPPDSAPGRTARQSRFGGYAVTGRTVTIAKPRSEVYAFWRDFSNLPMIMDNIEAVAPTGPDTYRWAITGPAGRSIAVETRVIDDRRDEQIAWRSVEGSDIDTEGKVTFRDAPGGRGTQVEAIVAYKPPAGELGRWIAKLFQHEPSIQARRELKRLKMLLETGEIATSQINKNAA
jgi:uncharacterized membrane protein